MFLVFPSLGPSGKQPQPGSLPRELNPVVSAAVSCFDSPLPTHHPNLKAEQHMGPLIVAVVWMLGSWLTMLSQVCQSLNIG